MTAAPRTPPPLREEIANAASHGLGLLLALAALPALAMQRDPRLTALAGNRGLWVFALSMLGVYLASSVYHALPAGRGKSWLQRVDHAAIFLFIAGSFTPFALRLAHGPLLLAAVWALALLGMALKLADRLRHRGLSTALYMAFGWALAVAAAPLLASLPLRTLAWVVGGGAAYSAGTVFFLLDERLRYGHLVWHLFVLAGSGCHFVAACAVTD